MVAFMEKSKYSDAEKKVIGSRIKELRTQKGWSQEELAKRIGYTSPSSRSTINKVELGINSITYSNLKMYAKVLGTTVAYLVGESEDASREELWEDFDSTHCTDRIKKEIKIFECIQELFGKDAAQLMHLFTQLNSQGQTKALDTLSDLSAIDKYKKDGE